MLRKRSHVTAAIHSVALQGLSVISFPQFDFRRASCHCGQAGLESYQFYSLQMTLVFNAVHWEIAFPNCSFSLYMSVYFHLTIYSN